MKLLRIVLLTACLLGLPAANSFCDKIQVSTMESAAGPLVRLAVDLVWACHLQFMSGHMNAEELEYRLSDVQSLLMAMSREEDTRPMVTVDVSASTMGKIAKARGYLAEMSQRLGQGVEAEMDQMLIRHIDVVWRRIIETK